MGRKSGRFRVGTSGYDYDHWRGVFYPGSLTRDERFGYYARAFDTVEINNTFYGLPGADTVRRWKGRAPKDFLYALKFSRYGSHMKHLKDPEQTIASFLDVVRRLDAALGPILVQLPPRWHADPERLRHFLDAASGELRWALEVRSRSWLDPGVYAVLRDAGAALCVHDRLDDHPWKVTADWLYVRYHGRDYGGRYAHQKLSADADRIAGHLEDGRDVYAYFNNDLEGAAVEDAAALRRYVSRRVA